MEGLFLIILVVAIWFFYKSSRKSVKPARIVKDLSNAVASHGSRKSTSKSNSGDVIERLAGSSPDVDTYDDEEKFENMLGRYEEREQPKKLEEALEKALNTFPGHLSDIFFKDDIWFRSLIELHENDIKAMVNLLEKDSIVAREINKRVNKEDILNLLSDALYDDFEDNEDEKFEKLRESLGPSSWLDMAISRFQDEYKEEIEDIKTAKQEQEKLDEVREYGFGQLVELIRESVPDIEFYDTKSYTVFHLEDKKTKWIARYHFARSVPMIELKDGTKEEIETIDVIDSLADKIYENITVVLER